MPEQVLPPFDPAPLWAEVRGDEAVVGGLAATAAFAIPRLSGKWEGVPFRKKIPSWRLTPFAA